MTPDDTAVLEICAGAGGQSSGLELAGFSHACAVEIDHDAATTLRLNRPDWQVAEADVREFDASGYRGITLLAGGIPCPPFSIAGKQLGPDDERDLFPRSMELVRQIRPDAVMLENVKGLASPRFDPYRTSILRILNSMGYETDWKLLQASWYGVPQLRPRFILVALRPRYFAHFEWPRPTTEPLTVGRALLPLMAAKAWSGASAWASRANGIAPTIVGGSKKHGGANLGPTRSRQAWRELGVDGRGIADQPPAGDAPQDHVPKLTNPMVAKLQGFPPDWTFAGRKTSVYRQIGNALPPPVAYHIGNALPPPVAYHVGLAIQKALAGAGEQRPEQPLFGLDALTAAYV